MATNKTVFFLIGILLIVLGVSMLAPYSIQVMYEENSHSFVSSSFVTIFIGILFILANLEKEFKFQNFLESQKFINKVSSIAEQEGHHPDIFFGWGYAKIKILTHAIMGLAESDFVLAAKIDQI